MRIEFIKHEQQRKYPGEKNKNPPKNVGACWTITKTANICIFKIKEGEEKED